MAFAFAQGDVAQAMTLAEDSLALAREAGDTRLISLALRDVGARSYELGKRAQGKALLQESLALAQQTPDKKLLADVLSSLASVSSCWTRIICCCICIAIRCRLPMPIACPPSFRVGVQSGRISVALLERRA